LRNKISAKRKITNNFQAIESIIHKNYSKREDEILKEVVNQWNKFRVINLSDALINGVNYKCWVEFDHFLTHGSPFIDIYIKDIGKGGKFSSEYGDLAILVVYYFENEIVNKKISLLQSKKENGPRKATIDLHQLYFMNFWPEVTFSGSDYSFPNVHPDQFSFYHFLLKYSHQHNIASLVYSAPYVYTSLGLNKQNIKKDIMKWLARKRTKPTKTYSIDPIPTPYSRTQWKLIPKPYVRFLKECAYLFFGTDNPNVIELSKKRIPNFLILYVAAAKQQRNLKESFEFF
jgi:hypothetical protein